MQKEVNEAFNNELQKQIEGELEKGHMNADKLANKSGSKYKNKHPFDLSEIKDLPKAINEPIAIFKSTKANDSSKIILTELKDKNGNNFVAILNVFENPKTDKAEAKVNSIRSIYPKDRAAELINWFKSGDKLVAWQNKKKASRFISDQSP
jgi:hypothetical protein